jgi:hypothetical protein
MANKKILAVAVGDTYDQTFSDSFNTDFTKVRPYIKGLVEWLALSTANRNSPEDEDGLGTFKLGTGANQYQIDYKQRPRGQISTAFSNGYDLIFCMSRTVVDAAATQFPPGANAPKIVGIVSDPFSANYGDNVCAVSATRPQLIARGAKRFKKKLKLDTLFALTIPNYAPAELAGKWVGKNVYLKPVNDLSNINNIKAVIDTCLPGQGMKAGLIVFPVDAFFGASQQIVDWAENRTQYPIPTFWTAPDFPATAYGGFGFDQKICGQYMAFLVATIFSTGNMPDQPYIAVDEKPRLRFGQDPFTVAAKKGKAGQTKSAPKRSAASRGKASRKRR